MCFTDKIKRDCWKKIEIKVKRFYFMIKKKDDWDAKFETNAKNFDLIKWDDFDLIAKYFVDLFFFNDENFE